MRFLYWLWEGRSDAGTKEWRVGGIDESAVDGRGVWVTEGGDGVRDVGLGREKVDGVRDGSVSGDSTRREITRVLILDS